jgi:oxalate decarboxylase/phosphoglucose isomerase-like protein (cupin superfamily)
VPLSQVTWKGGPGIWSAAVDGDPSVAGKPYSLYLKLADGQWIPPHWHPEDKRVFVVSGTLLMGMGTSLDKAAAVAQPAGTFNLVPAKTRHYEGAKGETILLLYGIGPLSTFYLK